MRCSLVILVLFSIHQCQSNDIRCQRYSEDSNSLEIYCENFSGKLPEKCSGNLSIPYSLNVTQLKIGGCSFDTVLDIIEPFNESIRVLDLSQSGFLNLEWMSLTSPLLQLQVLNVSHNKFERIPMEFVPNTPELRVIDLSYNDLKGRIEPDNRLKGAKKLEKVILAHNRISHIDNQTFQESPNLHFIDLSYNSLQWIPTFPPNKRLRVMHLEENTILSFDCLWIAEQNETSIHLHWTYVSIFDLEQTCHHRRIHVIPSNERDSILIKSNGIIELHCCERSFQELSVFQAAPHAFENIADIIQCFGYRLKIAALSNNIIGQIDPKVFENFVELQRLNLSNTMLSEFDVTRYRNQEALLALDVSRNSLKRLNNISKLSKLQELDVAENLIENIPDIIGGLPMTITYLDVSDNYLGPVNQTTFDWLMKLESLRLSKTALSFNDSNPFESLKELMFLDISRNNLNSSNFELLEETLGKLITFNASRCHIDGVSDIVRKLKPHLEELDLSGNSWGALHTNSLESLRELKMLNLNNTNLLSFDSTLFWHLNKLVNLDLSHNRIKTIDLQALSSRVEWLNLEENELVQIEHFAPKQKLALGITRNQLTCTDVKRLKHHPNVAMFGDPGDQKHQKDCQSSTQSIGDFMSKVYDTVVFW